MGYLDDLTLAVKTLASHASNAFPKAQNKKSIARGALEGTLQFPCLISESIPIDMAATIAKTLERVYASFVQTYLSMNSTIDISVDKTPQVYLKKFHRNIKLESTAIDLYHENCIETDEEFDGLFSRIYNGTTKAYLNESENEMIVFNFSDELNRNIFESHKQQLEESLSGIDFKPFPNVGNSPFYEALTPDEREREIEVQNIRQYYQADIQNIKNQGSMDVEIFKTMHGNSKPPSILKDNEIKKLNDLQPYQMSVKLMAINDQKEFVQFMEFIVGVKVNLHIVKTEDLVDNLSASLQNSSVIFNFIRWTTGEKELFKDLLFRINDLKLDIDNRSKGSSPWWMKFKRLKNTAKMQAAFFSKTRLVPQSTIVITEIEADLIMKQTGFDLRKASLAKRVLKELFLMSFIIVDDGNRTIDVLYDGENTYQTYALETLEREVSMNSNKIGKELTRMISR